MKEKQMHFKMSAMREGEDLIYLPCPYPSPTCMYFDARSFQRAPDGLKTSLIEPRSMKQYLLDGIAGSRVVRLGVDG